MSMQTKAMEILNIEYPIIQGPMSWITNADFVSRISNAGGLGVLGANAGQHQKADNAIDAAKKMQIEIQKAKKLTDKSFAVNIVMHDAMDDITDYVKKMLEVSFAEDIKYYVTVGVPNKIVFDEIKHHGGIIIHRPITPTIENMMQAEANGADILVATGCEAGGSLPQQQLTTAEIVKLVIPHIRVPLFAAGGINSIDDINTLSSYQIGGLFMGTLFIATKESPISESAKDLIISSKSGDLISVSSKLRSINTSKAQQLHNIYVDKGNSVDVNTEIKKLCGMKTGMLDGNIEGGIVSVNNHIDSISKRVSVDEIIAEFGEYLRERIS
ncbi:NAD(P)H-dependent flavin oxidoreductase [Apilactobacillus kunkeei]|uniref:Probable nitronate monooxygenase n=1 Tax=Apilactobacillus kunkeei TaxID=148814 RepID=A0A0N1IZZ5_9LACO|nr:nitronate monooxygenase [Apilactobacillus kunkeei]KOY79748.1 2-nitropropane dioxygenase NPD [Apilactobacillus kunkeei]